MENFVIRGGLKVGLTWTRWPLVKLEVDKDKLLIDSKVLGKYLFQPKDIISIEANQSFYDGGITIFHRKPYYYPKLIFLVSSPVKVLQKIVETGFIDRIDGNLTDEDQRIIQKQRAREFPVKSSVMVTISILSYFLLIVSILKIHPFNNNFNVLGIVLPLVFLLCLSVLTLFSEGFRRLVLKEGRTIKDIKVYLYLLIYMILLILACICIVLKSI
jgi:hypothetical protein